MTGVGTTKSTLDATEASLARFNRDAKRVRISHLCHVANPYFHVLQPRIRTYVLRTSGPRMPAGSIVIPRVRGRRILEPTRRLCHVEDQVAGPPPG
jgi:hypothetical protein